MSSSTSKIERQARLRWVPLAKMKVSPLAQREMKQYHVDRIAAHFDVEQLGTPTVSERDGSFYVVDGQHRAEAMKQMGWGDQQVQCWVYQDLDEQAEAEMFLRLNDQLNVSAFDKFRIGVNAGRDEECDIDRIVRAQDLTIAKGKSPGAVGAVTALRKVYARGGPEVLGRTLRIIRDAYGDPGLDGAVIEGIGLVTQRYNGELNDATAVDRLSNAHGGVNNLLGRAAVLKRQMGQSQPHCVAAAAVETINRGRGGKKLPDWWKS